MSIARFSLVISVALLALAGCGAPKKALIPVDSAILPWQPPEPPEEETPAEEPAPAPEGK